MAQVIEFYVPANHPFQWLWTPEDERGKLIAFPNTTPELSSLTQDEPPPLSRWPAYLPVHDCRLCGWLNDYLLHSVDQDPFFAADFLHHLSQPSKTAAHMNGKPTVRFFAY